MSRYHSARSERLNLAADRVLKGISSNDEGVYTCHGCGDQWKRRDRSAWWPVSLGWAWPTSTWFSWHGAQIGWDGIEQRVFANFLRLGPVIVKFGWREEWR